MVGFPTAGRFRELLAKYGKVAIGVHLSVSGISISGFYVAIKNNMDVEGALQRFGLMGKDVEEAMHREGDIEANPPHREGLDHDHASAPELEVNKDSSIINKNKALISGSSALVLAILCNKALLPVRVPLTFALTPPIARFLARRKLYSAGH
eukprot:c22523_g1_i1 orf=193-648(+)